jgi:cellulose synthase/poly-beta-1,6-N-acetylglucosamine synthase-like glycosyltransferase
MLSRVFWLSAAGVVYAYAGYPLVVGLLARGRGAVTGPMLADADLPAVTLLVPVHNERAAIEAKLANTRALSYPVSALKAVFISDGSTDGTAEIIAAGQDERIELYVLPERGGKAGALNAGLARTETPLVVFSDASIMLEPDSIRAIVRPFGVPDIGCVSGEDRIAGGDGEGLYGKYEMFLRRQESRLHSIVGASGSFYAQRRELCGAFVPNVAPDFLSVLRTVEGGFRAVSESSAVGIMGAVDNPRDEFERKVRTILRGLTTLGGHLHLLNPVRHGVFAFELFSHKLMRWLVPFLLLTMLMTSAVLAWRSIFYATLLVLQLAFYVLALGGLKGWLPAILDLPGRIAVYFVTVNLATLVAWLKYGAGARQELWSPSRR